MTRNDKIDPPPTRNAHLQIVDRHDEVVGRKADAGPDLSGGPLIVEPTDTVTRLLDLEGQSISVPLAWIAGVRRDEIRLSVALEDPLFRSGILLDPADPPGLGEPHPLSSARTDGIDDGVRGGSA